jgi:hypothetical protein
LQLCKLEKHAGLLSLLLLGTLLLLHFLCTMALCFE